MSININQDKHTQFFIKCGKRYTNSLEKMWKLWKEATQKGLEKDHLAPRMFVMALCLDPASSLADVVELICQLGRMRFYTGRYTEFVGQILPAHKSDPISVLASTRRDHINLLLKGAPIFKKTVTIDVTPFVDVENRKWVLPAASKPLGHLVTNMINPVREWANEKEDEFNPPLLPEDDWYPFDPWIEEPEPDYGKIPENDNDHFHVESSEPDGETVVQDLPNGQKLAEIRRNGHVHYIVIDSSEDISRLPEIYDMMLRQKLMLGTNITTDRLTRVMKIMELLNAGFTKKETAEYLDIPPHIVYGDVHIAKSIVIE